MDPRFSKTEEVISNFWLSIFDRAIKNPVFVLRFSKIVNTKFMKAFTGLNPFMRRFWSSILNLAIFYTSIWRSRNRWLKIDDGKSRKERIKLRNWLSLIFDQPFSILIFENQTDLIFDLRSSIIVLHKSGSYLPIYPLVFENSGRIRAFVNFWSTISDFWKPKGHYMTQRFVRKLGRYLLSSFWKFGSHEWLLLISLAMHQNTFHSVV